VDLDPRIPTPSLPAEVAPPEPAPQPQKALDLINITFRVDRRLKKVLKSRAGQLEKSLESMLSDILEAYMDKQDPQWRDR
jgi:hypothetical protein